MLTEAEILEDVLNSKEGGLTEAAARAILDLGFSDEAKEQIRSLLSAKNRDEISGEQAASLKNYLQVGQLIDLLQAKARLSLQR